jgi:hypothetical protein
MGNRQCRILIGRPAAGFEMPVLLQRLKRRVAYWCCGFMKQGVAFAGQALRAGVKPVYFPLVAAKTRCLDAVKFTSRPTAEPAATPMTR